MSDIVNISQRRIERSLEAMLSKANQDLGFIVEECKQALKFCMHPRSIQAEHLKRAIRRIEPDWKETP